MARTCARTFDLPVIIARMNTAYGATGGLPWLHLEAIAEGRPVVARVDRHLYSPIHHSPIHHSPIHEDDIAWQLEPLVAAAAVPAPIVNWGGDEPVAMQDWCAHLGAVLGREAIVETVPRPGTRQSNAFDSTRRLAITGPCRVAWRDGMAEMAAAFRRHREG